MTVRIELREPGDPGGDPLGAIHVAMTKAGDAWAVTLPRMARTSHSLIGAVRRCAPKVWEAALLPHDPVMDEVVVTRPGVWETREAARDALVLAWWRRTRGWQGSTRDEPLSPHDVTRWNRLDEHYPSSPSQDRAHWWNEGRERAELLSFLVHNRYLFDRPAPAFHRHQPAPAWLVIDHAHRLARWDKGLPLAERTCRDCPQQVSEHISFGMARWSPGDLLDPIDYCWCDDPEQWT